MFLQKTSNLKETGDLYTAGTGLLTANENGWEIH
jgi:hypothetical protein